MKKLIAGFLALATVAAIALPVLAVAENEGNGQGENHDQRDARMLGSTLEVHINDNGTVLVRGAKVTAKNGASLSASTSWGSAVVGWTVNTDSNTSVIRRAGGPVGIGDVSVGDTVSFQGNLATTASNLVVNARTLKDWSIAQPVVQPSVARVYEGTLQSIAGTVAPTSMVVRVGDVNYTVNVAANISVLNNLWLSTSLANFHVGDHIRLYGTLDGTTINASVVRDTNIVL